MTTTTQYLTDWLALRSGALRPRTVDQYRSLIRLHIAPTLGQIPAEDLVPGQVRQLLARICAAGHSRTAELVYITLHQALPASVTGIERPAHVQQSPEAWGDDHIRVYLDALNTHPHGLALLLCIALGLRRGEVAGLRWQDIDWTRGVIHVVNQRYRLDNGQIVDGSPKSAAGIRPIPLPPALLARLKASRQIAGYIDPITPGGLYAAHRTLVKRLNLPYTPLHGLRHTMATSVVRHGGDIRSLQLIIGHAKYATTADRYTHPDTDMLRTAIDSGPLMCYNQIASFCP